MDGGKRKSVSGRSATSKKLRKSNTENKSLKKTIGKQEETISELRAEVSQLEYINGICIHVYVCFHIFITI